LKLLDQAHNVFLGQPEITTVENNVVEGKCILISGHDLHDLYELLIQTEGSSINV